MILHEKQFYPASLPPLFLRKLDFGVILLLFTINQLDNNEAL